MRIIIALWMMLIVQIALSDLIVTDQDVQIRFPDAAEPDNVWYNISIIGVSYWQEAVGTHNPKAKLKQTWEAELQAKKPELGKVRFSIEIIALPKIAEGNAPARRMEIHLRVRDVVKDIVRGISDFSVFNYVDVIGNPGQPANTGG